MGGPGSGWQLAAAWFGRVAAASSLRSSPSASPSHDLRTCQQNRWSEDSRAAIAHFSGLIIQEGKDCRTSATMRSKGEAEILRHCVALSQLSSPSPSLLVDTLSMADGFGVNPEAKSTASLALLLACRGVLGPKHLGRPLWSASPACDFAPSGARCGLSPGPNELVHPRPETHTS